MTTRLTDEQILSITNRLTNARRHGMSEQALLVIAEELLDEVMAIRRASRSSTSGPPLPPTTEDILRALSPVESPGEEGAQIEKEAYEGVVREVVSALASGSPMCACRAHLGDRFRNPATCVGAYEDPRNLQFGCEACCSHGNEDGWCVPLRAPAAAESTRADLAEIADRLEAGMVGPAVKVIVVREAVAALRSLRAPREVEEVREALRQADRALCEATREFANATALPQLRTTPGGAYIDSVLKVVERLRAASRLSFPSGEAPERGDGEGRS